jgi:transposase
MWFCVDILILILPRFDGHLNLLRLGVHHVKSQSPYPAEFRQQIVELAATRKTPKELSDEFGVSVQTVVNWVGASKAGVTIGAKGKQSSRSAEQEEIARLRRELTRQ